jgi:NAD(P)-dependent dehydrogenase (short-subunit alcohol dehydrogenase family)
VSAAGKVVWITGGAQGFGAAVGRRLASEGATVVLSDINADRGETVAAEIGGSFVACDVSDFDANRAAVDQVLSLHGRLDVAFLNAGVALGGGVGDDFDVAAYRRVMGINLDGVVFGAHCAFGAMRANGGGDIIATASLAGLVGTPFDPLYGANKHGVVGLVRSLGPDWEPHGIRVNALCPGFADTAIVDPIRGVLSDAGLSLIPVDRVVEAFMAILDSGQAGQCWYVQPGRVPEPFRFRNIPGPRTDES